MFLYSPTWSNVQTLSSSGTYLGFPINIETLCEGSTNDQSCLLSSNICSINSVVSEKKTFLYFPKSSYVINLSCGDSSLTSDEHENTKFVSDSPICILIKFGLNRVSNLRKTLEFGLPEHIFGFFGHLG